jgi:hypothetical protein
MKGGFFITYKEYINKGEVNCITLIVFVLSIHMGDFLPFIDKS